MWRQKSKPPSFEFHDVGLRPSAETEVRPLCGQLGVGTWVCPFFLGGGLVSGEARAPSAKGQIARAIPKRRKKWRKSEDCPWKRPKKDMAGEASLPRIGQCSLAACPFTCPKDPKIRVHLLPQETGWTKSGNRLARAKQYVADQHGEAPIFPQSSGVFWAANPLMSGSQFSAPKKARGHGKIEL